MKKLTWRIFNNERKQSIVSYSLQTEILSVRFRFILSASLMQSYRSVWKFIRTEQYNFSQQSLFYALLLFYNLLPQIVLSAYNPYFPTGALFLLSSMVWSPLSWGKAAGRQQTIYTPTTSPLPIKPPLQSLCNSWVVFRISSELWNLDNSWFTLLGLCP